MNFRSQIKVRTCPNIRDSAPETVQSQYSASPVILGLVRGFQTSISPGMDITLFYQKIFDIMTAEGWGLDNWGRILAMGRLLKVPTTDNFSFYGSELVGFDQGPFYSPSLTDTYALADPAFLELLLIKALANISAADAETLNTLLRQLFPGQPVYVLETGIMTIRFVFEFYLTPWQRAIFSTPGLLTRGAGVGSEWLEVAPDETFGFAGSELNPFNQGVFFPGGPVPITN